jgi:hypothetical protein
MKLLKGSYALFKKTITFFSILPLKVYICGFRTNNKTMTTLNELNAISPIDGRYRNKTLSLALFSRKH